MKFNELKCTATSIIQNLQKHGDDVEVSIDELRDGYIEVGRCAFYFKSWVLTDSEVSL